VAILGATLVITAPAARAGTPLAAAQSLCDVVGGTFATEVFGGQSHSTCTLTLRDGVHRIHYTEGLVTGSDLVPER
jgi:hypothetical protein